MSDSRQIYLDANSTAALRPATRGVLRDFADGVGDFKNPSSVHTQGQKARALLRTARTNILNFLSRGHLLDAELFFTSGATEGCNALVSGFTSPSVAPRHILTTAIEHPAMIESVKLCESRGISVTWVRPESNGIVDVEKFVSAIRPETDLVSIMTANNESGAIQPVAEIAFRLRAAKYFAPIVSDFTQAFGKTKILLPDLFQSGVNAIAFSGHKIGALTGIGCVVLNTRSDSACFTFTPSVLGGSQENRRRAGTENLIGAATLGEVARVLDSELDLELSRIEKLRDLLWTLLGSSLPGIERLTPRAPKSLPNTLLVRIPELRGDDLVVALDLLGVCCSTGSACASGKQGVSHVVEAQGFEKKRREKLFD